MYCGGMGLIKIYFMYICFVKRFRKCEGNYNFFIIKILKICYYKEFY